MMTKAHRTPEAEMALARRRAFVNCPCSRGTYCKKCRAWTLHESKDQAALIGAIGVHDMLKASAVP